ncbi:MAG: hypothetical protein FWC70_08980 [Defluviitaleaceae bacterium]|nr:hypothetical protein [Defluviitaleaceae bacterium]
MSEINFNEDNFEDLFAPANFKACLRCMSHFHGYSRQNILLIYRQMPHATKLAEFGDWKQQGRKIIRNSKTITLEGKKLLDISQTVGEPMPRLAGNVLSGSSLCAAFFEAVKSLCSAGNAETEAHSLPEIIQRIAHENIFIAKSVAFVVLTRFGIDSADAPQAAAHDAGNFAETLDAIRAKAHEIIVALEERLTEICNERGINPMTTPKTIETIETTPEITLEKPSETTSSQFETKLKSSSSRAKQLFHFGGVLFISFLQAFINSRCCFRDSSRLF